VTPVDSATLWAVSEAMPPRERLAVLLGGFLGLREAEVLDLRWEDVDLDPVRPVISVEHQVIERKGGMVSTPKTKTDSAHRLVPIPAALLPAVRDHLQTYCQGSGNPLLFTRSDKDSRWLAFSTYRRHVYAAMIGQGLPVTRDGYTIHDLRHVSLTRIPLAGGTMAEAKALGGHSGEQSWRVYQDVDADHLAAVTDNLSAMMLAGRPDRYGSAVS
jgi:integrase